MQKTTRAIGVVTGFLLCGLATVNAGAADWRDLKVTATAYNSVAAQTDANPSVAAWGDVLKPGMKAIAVSRDLIARGLAYGTRVRIEGLKGVYVVLDKMHGRWKDKIDIYMGTDVDAALQWGVRKDIRISWQVDPE